MSSEVWTAGLQSFDGVIKLVIFISSVMGPFACLPHVCLRFLGIPIINSSSSFILCVHVWKQKTRLWRETILCGITGRIYLEARMCKGGNLGYNYNQPNHFVRNSCACTSFSNFYTQQGLFFLKKAKHCGGIQFWRSWKIHAKCSRNFPGEDFFYHFSWVS